ncbi:hypothetical protein EAY64_09265 [Aquitalea palustris]|uniref:Uncharacterized protein n=1 Tax=Aquitalea palustris TaxID=2480983 RepID=A0A454JIY5_9NEIS|nr:hypothetical protein [Aquitalea palustris]RMC98548.1 hypothetical protein EAY64_09265 [Aquitalea palustris]
MDSSSATRGVSGRVDVNGTSVTVLSHTWEVADRQTWSKTKVELSGGGGYVGPYGGYVNAPQLVTHVAEQQEIWLRDEHGKEIPLRLHNGGIAVRVGHRVTVAGIEAHGQSWLVEVRNTDTGHRKRMMASWGQLLHQAAVLPRPRWLDFSINAKVVRILAFGLVSWLLAVLIFMMAYRFGIVSPSKAEQLQNQIRLLEHQSIDASSQRVRRDLEHQAQELYPALSLERAADRRNALLWVNGLGISFLLSGMLWQHRQTGQYRRNLSKAEERLERLLVPSSQKSACPEIL